MTSLAKMHLKILADPEALARHVADWLLTAAVAGVRPFAVALSGGSTPRRLYQLLGLFTLSRGVPLGAHPLVLGR